MVDLPGELIGRSSEHVESAAVSLEQEIDDLRLRLTEMRKRIRTMAEAASEKEGF